MPGPGDILGDSVAELAGTVLDWFYKSIWNGSQALLRGAFGLADQFTTFSLTDGGGRFAAGSPLASVWPIMKWIALAVAVGLFFAQLTLTAVRGGRGMFRAVTGPIQFAMAMALTVGGVGALLATTDGLTTFLLQTGLGSGNFVGVLDAPAVAARMGQNPDLGDVADEDVRATVLAFTALLGFIPASISFALQMIFRQAAVLVLVATVPITAAGLLSDSTSAWFWRALRWMLAAALIKPTLALILVIGINMMSSTTGVAGLIAGAAVLLISVFAPMTLYRLMAFVDPATGHGQAIRSPSLRQNNEPSSDGGSSEATNTARFAEAGGRRPSGSASGATGTPSTGTGPAGAGTASGAAAGGTAGGGAAGGGAAGGGAAGGGAAGGGAAAAGGGAGGGAGGALAVAGLVVQAAQAADGWANNQMTQFAVGHPGGAAPGSGAGSSRRRAGGDRSADTPEQAPGDDRDVDEQPGRGAVSAPPESGPTPAGRYDDARDRPWVPAGPRDPADDSEPRPARPPAPSIDPPAQPSHPGAAGGGSGSGSAGPGAAGQGAGGPTAPA